MAFRLLADANSRGHVKRLVRHMQSPTWRTLWDDLGLTLVHFQDVGLALNAPDLEVWRTCQREGLILLTDNRNGSDEESLEAVIRSHGVSDSLPVVTIGSIKRLRSDADYAEQVVEAFYDYLTRLDEVKGTGRLYLP